VNENVVNENVVRENVLSGNVEIANVDHTAIAEKDEIAARAAAVVADRHRRNAKDPLFDKCIRRRIKRQSLRTWFPVKSQRATWNSPASLASDGSHAVP